MAQSCGRFTSPSSTRSTPCSASWIFDFPIVRGPCLRQALCSPSAFWLFSSGFSLCAGATFPFNGGTAANGRNIFRRRFAAAGCFFRRRRRMGRSCRGTYRCMYVFAFALELPVEGGSKPVHLPVAPRWLTLPAPLPTPVSRPDPYVRPVVPRWGGALVRLRLAPVVPRCDGALVARPAIILLVGLTPTTASRGLISALPPKSKRALSPPYSTQPPLALAKERPKARAAAIVRSWNAVAIAFSSPRSRVASIEENSK